MTQPPDITSQLRRELDETRARLAEAEEALHAIRHGEVDSLVVAGPEGDQVFTLKGAQEPYRLLIEQMSEGAVTLSRDGVILYANQLFARLLQMPLEKVIGKTVWNFIKPADQRILSGLIEKAWSGSSHGEVFVCAADGSFIPLRLGLSPLRLDAEAVVCCIVATDLMEQNRKEQELRQLHADLERRIAERTADLATSRLAALNMMEEAVEAQMRAEKAEDAAHTLNVELEQRVAARTAELVAANKELDAFSSSVSHDLRAPLRSVAGFAGILTEDYSQRLDEEGRRLLGTITDEVNRMSRMIDELLEFSRLGRHEMETVECDMMTLAKNAVDQCAAQASGRNIQFKFDSLPSARGDEHMILHVWSNLISNAIKYTKNKPVAEIKFTSRVNNGDEIAYCVQDNGAGFDMKYAHKLFGMFQRLHTEAEFEGTGVGLALAQRVVQRHGGRMWAEGEVNKGAAFYFTLPFRRG